MSFKQHCILIIKILAAKWLRIRSPLTEQELDAILQACEGQPDLRPTMEEVLSIRR